MIPHHAVPDSMQAAENDFSAHLRACSQKDGTSSQGLNLYRTNVRENVISVLLCVFPIFCRSLKAEEIRMFADAFIMQHQATRPQFHQLATELLIFIHNSPEAVGDNLCVIEYEWLIYSLEIDEREIPLPDIRGGEHMNLHNVDVVVNPTLRVVALPFQLTEGGGSYKGKSCEYYYAIYRKHNNTLYHKKVDIYDIQLLQEVSKAGISVEMLYKTGSCLTMSKFKLWLAENNKDEVISLILKG